MSLTEDKLKKLEQDVEELKCLAEGGHYWQGQLDGELFTCSHCFATTNDKDYYSKNAICIGTAENLQNFLNKKKGE